MHSFCKHSVVLFAMTLGLAADAAAITVTVNSTGNSSDVNAGNGVCATSGGVCTLRAAIQETNARSGLDTIRFEIGSGGKRISLSSQLPTITSPVILDGWTQPGFAGTPLIELTGDSGDGLRISAGASLVRGLVINGFPGRGVVLSGSGNNVLEGNYIGLAADGVEAVPNRGSGVYILGSSNNRIGGTTIQQRNVISGNLPVYTPGGNLGGIEIHDASGTVIQGNFIGTDVTGMEDRGNIGRGISLVHATNTVIGGPEAGAANLIAGNFATGIRVRESSRGTLIQGNIIGLNRTLTAALSNDRGVQIRGGSYENQVIGNVIAGQVFNGVLIWEDSDDNIVHSNVIAFNGFGERDPLCSVCDNQEDYNGVLVWEGESNYIIGNRIWGNRHAGLLVANQAPSPAAPTLTLAKVTGGVTTIAGQISGPSGVEYVIDLFASSACDVPFAGEAEYFIGQRRVTAAANGVATFELSLAWSAPPGWAITATGTRAGFNTSNFSACKSVQ